MQTLPLRVRATCSALAVLATLASSPLWTTVAHAQSGSVNRGSAVVPQSAAPQGSTTAGSATAGSTSHGSGTMMPGSGTNAAPVAMNGYCPVCILEMKKWVKGNPNFSVTIDGKQYLFPGEMQKQKFLENTTKYTPALGGDCVVCAVDGGARMPGSVFYSAIHDGRLFLFPGEKEKAAFMANPRKYENADLALGGMCTVCRVEMNKEMPGKPEFGTVYGGMRYYFPGMEQMKMFMANPTKYAVKKQ